MLTQAIYRAKWEGRRIFFCVLLFFWLFFLSLTWGLGELILSQPPFLWLGLGESLVPGDIYLAGLARWIGASGLCVLQILIGFWIFYIQGRWERKLYFKKIFLLLLLNYSANF